MEKIIADFAHSLAKGGIKISITEITDALRALNRFGLDNEGKFYQILKAAMVKDAADYEVFDLAYNLYFHKAVPADPSAKPATPCHKGDIPLKGTAGMSDKAKSFYGAILQSDQAAIAAAASEAVSEADLSSLDLEGLLHQVKVTLSWFMVENALEMNHCSAGQEQLGHLEQELRVSLAQKLAATQSDAANTLLAAENLTEKDFNSLSARQVKAMEKRVEKLGRQLGSRYSYRLKPSKQGIINMRKVMAETAKRGYPPSRMHYLAKKRDKPSLLILCDISGSMAQYSSFFLQLVYAMEKRFQDIQSFLFIDNIVAANFPRNSNNTGAAIAAAILEAYVPRTGRTGQHCTTTGVSDYGKAFHFFLEKFSATLEPHKTVLILGDAKNNWFPAKRENLQAIAQKVKEIIWLNPQPQAAWNTEDSVINVYAPYCRRVVECRNLKQLTEIAQQLS